MHNNLRISVTDRCNIRCVYCMPENGRVPAAAAAPDASRRSSGSCGSPCTLGIDKIRLTGGEPLVRRDLPALVEKLAAIPGIKDIGLTTNGILLAPLAQALWDAGLRRINVSLDTLDPARFQRTDPAAGLRAGDRGHPGGQGRRVSTR